MPRSSLIAIKGPNKQEVLKALRLEDTGQEAGRTGVYGAELPSGWVCIWSIDDEFASTRRIVAASQNAFAIGCATSTVTMYSSAVAYSDGQKLWSVDHDPSGEGGRFNLDISGAPPAELAVLRERLFREQEEEGDGVDVVYEIPLEIVRSVCGIRTDDFDPKEIYFTALRPSKPTQPLWRRLITGIKLAASAMAASRAERRS